MSATVTATLGEYSAGTDASRLPAGIVEQAKKVIFDETACAYFGRRSAAGALAARYSASMGTPREASIFGTDLKTSAAYAAMANGTAGHGEEVDGAHVSGGHPGASIVHAATGMAERQHATGGDLINAVVLGYDIGVRIVRACGGKFVVRDRHKLTSDFFYALGCTAAAGRIIGLDALRHAHAFALVTFQANGLYALYSEKRHISKSFCNGQYAFAGISSALMAAAGLEGNEDIIGYKYGVLDTWGEETRRDEITRGLGSDFAISGANFKFFNAGYPIHTPVEAAMSLAREHSIAADAITRVQVGMPENAMRVVDNRDMHNICVQDMLAASLASGGIALIDQPFPAMLSNPGYQRLRPLIEVGVDPDIQREFPDGRGARVTITTGDGASVSRRIDHPRGHSLRGEVSWDDLAEKWQGSLPGCDVDLALSMARRLDDLDDVTLFTAAFAGIHE